MVILIMTILMCNININNIIMILIILLMKIIMY